MVPQGCLDEHTIIAYLHINPLVEWLFLSSNTIFAYRMSCLTLRTIEALDTCFRLLIRRRMMSSLKT